MYDLPQENKTNSSLNLLLAHYVSAYKLFEYLKQEEHLCINIKLVSRTNITNVDDFPLTRLYMKMSSWWKPFSN